MAMGHDILIYVDEKMQSYFYRTLVSYIGKSYPKEFSKETVFKNGIRIIKKNCSLEISNGQIKKWAQTRLYFFKHTIIMDINKSTDIFQALLKSLYDMPEKKETINKLIKEHFEMIKNEGELYSRQLSILEDIYRELLRDSGTNIFSEEMCAKLSDINSVYG